MQLNSPSQKNTYIFYWHVPVSLSVIRTGAYSSVFLQHAVDTNTASTNKPRAVQTVILQYSIGYPDPLILCTFFLCKKQTNFFFAHDTTQFTFELSFISQYGHNGGLIIRVLEGYFYILLTLASGLTYE